MLFERIYEFVHTIRRLLKMFSVPDKNGGGRKDTFEIRVYRLFGCGSTMAVHYWAALLLLLTAMERGLCLVCHALTI